MLTALLLVASLPSRLACSSRSADSAAQSARVRLVFKYQPLGNDIGPLRHLIAGYQQVHPEVEVVVELLPNATNAAHQYFLTALEGGAEEFDVLVVDIVWVQEFARAGWIADLTEAFPSALIQRDFLAGAAEAVLMDDRTYAVPWYADVGLLYYRTDLVARGPKTYDELKRFTAEALRAHPQMQGFVWQGRQYEGLVCNVYEAVWGHGADPALDHRLRVDTPEAREALGYLRSLLEERLSPPSVTSAGEEDSRRAFQSGAAVFMRNWPYAWEEAERQGSPIRGKVGFAPLPSVRGEPGPGVLGGWQLAINARSPQRKRKAALALVAHLTSVESNVALALAYGRNPPRRSAYQHPELRARAPFIAALYPILERARPRPVTPYYNLLSDALQSEFSAAVSGVRSPDLAVRRAQQQIDRITEGNL
jgi:multiple sugar transport system substrate-binding protein